MGRKGRPRKVVVELTTRFGVGFDGMNYTIERYDPAQDQWRPEAWYGTLAHLVDGLIERQVRNRAMEMFGEGVTRIKEGAVQRILKEVSEDERRLYDRLSSVEFFGLDEG